MKKSATVLLLQLLTHISSSQNLVPNPSFEDTVACPNGLNQVNHALGWSSFRETPDYFNTCAGDTLFGVPNNAYGYQIPATGNACAGLQAFFTPGFRECIGCMLINPLTIGVTYQISLKLVRAHGGVGAAFCGCNKVGLKFTTIQYDFTSPIPINNFAHVYADSIISDTLNWSIVSGTLIADSAYVYLSIGNFFDDQNTDTVSYAGSGCRAIYYVDDVSVIVDTLLSIGNANHETVKIYPNPVSDKVQILFSNHDEKSTLLGIEITNTVGQVFKVLDAAMFQSSEKTSVDISEIPVGIYFMTFKFLNRIKTFKITKI